MAKTLGEIKSIVDQITSNRKEYVDVPIDLTEQLSFLINLQKRYCFPLFEEVRKSILLYPYKSEDFVEICEKLVWVGDFFKEIQFSDSLDGILRVRNEIHKRTELKRNLKKLTTGILTFKDIKALLSGLVRVTVEYEQHNNYDGMRPVLLKLLSILQNSLEKGLSDNELRLIQFIFLGGEQHD